MPASFAQKLLLDEIEELASAIRHSSQSDEHYYARCEAISQLSFALHHTRIALKQWSDESSGKLKL